MWYYQITNGNKVTDNMKTKNKEKTNMKKLWHYTSFDRLVNIKMHGKLYPSSSNLLMPKGQMRVRPSRYGTGFYEIYDDTSDYKPVVWLTSSECPDSNALGLTHVKTQVRMLFKTDAEPWSKFADENKMDKTWRKAIEKGRKPDTWFVHEGELSLDECEDVQFRADDGTWTSIL